MTRIILLLLIFVSVFTLSCNQQVKDTKPVADTEIAVIETADFGTIKIELYSNVAPKHVARFKELTNEKFYDRTQIHRIDPNLGIIQGGDPNSKDDDPKNDGAGSSGKPNLPAEFSDVLYDTGILGAARTNAPNTANCQFFIMTKRQPAFDKKYTVFGKVIEGQNIVNQIADAPKAAGTERPAAPIIIKSVTIQKK